LGYPNSFESTIPNELNLPILKSNIAEGIVIIRPNKTSYFENGVRVILKSKNEKWAENKKYHKPIRKKDKVSKKVMELQAAIQNYVTENRLNNVVSKIGEITKKDFREVMRLFSTDVVEDFLKDYSHLTEELEKKELKAITKSFAKRAMELVKEKIQNP